MAANVPGLGEVAELEAQMFSFAQMFIRIPNVQFSTESATFAKPLLQAALLLSSMCCPVELSTCLSVGLAALLHFFVWLLRWKKCKCAANSVGNLFSSVTYSL
jgi:hypothetical protein